MYMKLLFNCYNEFKSLLNVYDIASTMHIN